MGNLYIGILLLLVLDASVLQASNEICSKEFKRGSCICDLADGSGRIDLTKLVNQTANAPLEAIGPDKSKYLMVLCGTIKGPIYRNCAGVSASCEVAGLDFSSDLGDPETTRFESRKGPDNPNPTRALIVDATRTGSKRTVAFLNCDRNIKDVIFTAQGTKDEQDEDLYYLYYAQLTGEIFCPTGGGGNGQGGLSGGSIFLIILFTIAGAYFIFGFLVSTFALKKEGLERIPHHAFWLQLPFLAKEGAIFTWLSMLHCMDAGCQSKRNNTRSGETSHGDGPLDDL